MTVDSANAYLRTKVMTASPAELRLMLIEGAIKFCRQGRDGLAARDYEACYNGLSQAKAIILELINGLRPEIDAELCSKLSALYTFMYRRLLDATLEKSPEIVDEVVKLLDYERETWVLLIERLAEERHTGPAPESHESTAAVAGAPRHSPLSIEG
ncbi:MAG: flagellar export chaperone FliS [Planctomycetota bacterium]|nr:flagellar export chaperone FliS [Planctomycetota bacterium]